MNELKEIMASITTIVSRLDVWLDDHKEDNLVKDNDKKLVKNMIASLAMANMGLRLVDMSMEVKSIKEEEEPKKVEEKKNEGSNEENKKPKDVFNVDIEGVFNILFGGA